MPSELPCEEKNFKIEDLKQMQGSINIALEDLCNLVGVYSSLEDSRVEASIANKMNSIKETVAKLEVLLID
jgi:hypothetical protein